MRLAYNSRLSRNLGMADGCAIVIAVRRMLELRDAQRLPPASFLHCPADCSVGAIGVHASAAWWPGPALGGMRLADAAIRCESRGLNWLLRFNRPLGGPCGAMWPTSGPYLMWL